MKTLLLSLVILATLASCGKNNKVSSADVAAPGVGITNPLITGNSQAQALVSMINNPAAFGQGAISSGSTSGQTCGVKWGIFTYCYSSGSSSGTSTGQTWAQVVAANPSITYQYSNGLTVRNSDVAIATKQAELTSILNQATRVDVVGPIFYVTTANAQYAIDSRYPIQLLPNGVISNNGTNYYFVRAI
jgi:hypothetical protein